ncbi:hypothetical protein E2C01_039815 [Portunus trituberculatus]|uniref:Uncharacterized protein n=1 Tax=Portunus trituberculatus TaxID=210409 RepID=A0A5B7FKS4_PORTR|nr:hypothetical protein [Portunus trituberculatus]
MWRLCIHVLRRDGAGIGKKSEGIQERPSAPQNDELPCDTRREIRSSAKLGPHKSLAHSLQRKEEEAGGSRLHCTEGGHKPQKRHAPLSEFSEKCHLHSVT